MCRITETEVNIVYIWKWAYLFLRQAFSVRLNQFSHKLRWVWVLLFCGPFLSFEAFSVILSLILMAAKLCLVSLVDLVLKKASCLPPAVGGFSWYWGRILGPRCLLSLLPRRRCFSFPSPHDVWCQGFVHLKELKAFAPSKKGFVTTLQWQLLLPLCLLSQVSHPAPKLTHEHPFPPTLCHS